MTISGIDRLKVLYPQDPSPQNREELLDIFVDGFPDYEKDPHRKGLVILDRAWVNENMVLEWFPLVGMRYVHRAMVIPLYRALSRVAASPLADTIKSKQCGTFVARFKGWNPRRTLSLHAVGLAIDINWNTNGYGTKGDLDPFIVKCFKDEGFDWGGDWSTPDPMHFQYAHKLISIPRPR